MNVLLLTSKLWEIAGHELTRAVEHPDPERIWVYQTTEACLTVH